MFASWIQNNSSIYHGKNKSKVVLIVKPCICGPTVAPNKTTHKKGISYWEYILLVIIVIHLPNIQPVESSTYCTCNLQKG